MMSETSDLFLMVDPVGDQAAPVSGRAFTEISAPVARVLARNCVALFLGSDGRVFRIEDIRCSNTGLAGRIGLWMGRPIAATFDLQEVETSLDDIRTMVLDAMMYSRGRGAQQPAWWLVSAPESEVRAQLLSANSLAELHRAIRFPADEHCLGLL